MHLDTQIGLLGSNPETILFAKWLGFSPPLAFATKSICQGVLEELHTRVHHKGWSAHQHQSWQWTQKLPYNSVPAPLICGPRLLLLTQKPRETLTHLSHGARIAPLYPTADPKGDLSWLQHFSPAALEVSCPCRELLGDLHI